VKILANGLEALALVLTTPMVAHAASLSLTGRVALISATPVNNAPITVVFHGHEMGIHEYTTERRVQVQTNAAGEFSAVVKVPDDRYIWTHATLEIAETDMSKAAIAIARCEIDGQGGGRCSKEFRVNPLTLP